MSEKRRKVFVLFDGTFDYILGVFSTLEKAIAYKAVQYPKPLEWPNVMIQHKFIDEV